MFPLAANSFPTSSAELAIALHGALAELFRLPSGPTTVLVEDGSFPDVERLTIDLTGATVIADRPPADPRGVGDRSPALSVAKLRVGGSPVRYQTASLQFELTATGAKFDADRDAAGRPVLVLADAADGHVRAAITRADLEAVALAAANAAAKSQGVTIQELSLAVRSEGPRSVSARVRIKAKKGFLPSGVVNVSGRLDVDDALVATLSGLVAAGDGMVGNLAAGLIQPELQQHEGRRIPLMAFSLGDLKLRDLNLAAGETLTVSAAFGRA